MNENDIKTMIENGLTGGQVSVTGDGTHFEAIVVYDGFAEKSVLEQHRMVYATLGDSMQSAIHALSIKTFTTKQWEQAQKLQVL